VCFTDLSKLILLMVNRFYAFKPKWPLKMTLAIKLVVKIDSKINISPP
jgi:hypothetical protein